MGCSLALLDTFVFSLYDFDVENYRFIDLFFFCFLILKNDSNGSFEDNKSMYINQLS